MVVLFGFGIGQLVERGLHNVERQQRDGGDLPAIMGKFSVAPVQLGQTFRLNPPPVALIQMIVTTGRADIREFSSKKSLHKFYLMFFYEAVPSEFYFLSFLLGTSMLLGTIRNNYAFKCRMNLLERIDGADLKVRHQRLRLKPRR